MPATTINQNKRMEALLRRIEKLPADASKYVEMENCVVHDLSMRSFLVESNLGTKWIPENVMKKKDGKIFIHKWFLNTGGKL